jgi:murein L,D-transpeptidase YafK
MRPQPLSSALFRAWVSRNDGAVMMAKWISNNFKTLFALTLFVLLSATLTPAAGATMARKADLVVVYKQQRILKLLSGGDTVRQYSIALGFNPQGHKRREGDGRTPEGAYRIDWRNEHSNFHLSLHIDYPRPTDYSQQADGLATSAISADPGRDIMIHGLPNGISANQIGHPSVDWTSGCIAVTNAEIEEIWRLVDDGTAVLILPD